MTRNYTCDGDNALARLNARVKAFNAGKKLSQAALAEMRFEYEMWADTWRRQGFHVEVLQGA